MLDKYLLSAEVALSGRVEVGLLEVMIAVLSRLVYGWHILVLRQRAVCQALVFGECVFVEDHPPQGVTSVGCMPALKNTNTSL